MKVAMPRPSQLPLLALPLLALAVFAAGSIGCHKSSSTETPTPTPTPTPVTESFTGSIGQKGADSHNFTVATVGDVKIKLTSLAPLDTLAVGVGIGTPDTTLTPPCSLTAEDTSVH